MFLFVGPDLPSSPLPVPSKLGKMIPFIYQLVEGKKGDTFSAQIRFSRKKFWENRKHYRIENQKFYTVVFSLFRIDFCKKSYLRRKKFALIFVSSLLGRAFGVDAQMMTSYLTILFGSVQFVKLILH